MLSSVLFCCMLRYGCHGFGSAAQHIEPTRCLGSFLLKHATVLVPCPVVLPLKVEHVVCPKRRCHPAQLQLLCSFAVSCCWFLHGACCFDRAVTLQIAASIGCTISRWEPEAVAGGGLAFNVATLKVN